MEEEFAALLQGFTDAQFEEFKACLVMLGHQSRGRGLASLAAVQVKECETGGSGLAPVVIGAAPRPQ